MDYIEGREGTWGAISEALEDVRDPSLAQDGFGDRYAAARWLSNRMDTSACAEPTPAATRVRVSQNPPASSAATRKTMQANRAKNTKPELTLRRLLREAGYTGYRLHWKQAPGRPDIAYPGRKIAIFVNGCFWHRCPACSPPMPKSNTSFWQAKFAANRERDERKTAELRDAGWTVVTTWECELEAQSTVLPPEVARALESAPGHQRH